MFRAPIVDADIRRAETLPGEIYTDPRWFEHQRSRVFSRSWQLVADTDRVKVPGACAPTTVLEGCLDESILFTRDATDTLHCISNVCTHRGTLVCTGPSVAAALRCRYHGRRFDLSGRFLSMPEFEATENFPTAADNLRTIPFARWGKFLFASLDPALPFAELTSEMTARLSWLPLAEAVLDPTRSRDYLVRANWALYCDNYLEGFHIPFVHAGLASVLDYSSYRTELWRWSNLQLGVASGGESTFELPRASPDFGQHIAAYYVWLFPNTMLNFYPWGISANIVQPLAVDRTRVSFLTYVWDPTRLEQGAGAQLDRVEREDEEVVESVHRGLKSSSYRRGRYSPTRETGVHHFHRLLTQFLAATK
ncbi:MAG: aromatic ring-hydroxylating oxygenase subunit alpha [Planctomycetota bacterium]